LTLSVAVGRSSLNEIAVNDCESMLALDPLMPTAHNPRPTSLPVPGNAIANSLNDDDIGSKGIDVSKARYVSF
jgi:hypothetical protein